MLRNGVNYKGLYGNLRTCFEIENIGHELKKMAYLVSSISCQCSYAIFWPFQRDLVGFRFVDFLSMYIEENIYRKEISKPKTHLIALKWPKYGIQTLARYQGDKISHFFSIHAF